MESLKRQIRIKDDEYEGLDERYREKSALLTETEEKLDETTR